MFPVGVAGGAEVVATSVGRTFLADAIMIKLAAEGARTLATKRTKVVPFASIFQASSSWRMLFSKRMLLTTIVEIFFLQMLLSYHKKAHFILST